MEENECQGITEVLNCKQTLSELPLSLYLRPQCRKEGAWRFQEFPIRHGACGRRPGYSGDENNAHLKRRETSDLGMCPLSYECQPQSSLTLTKPGLVCKRAFWHTPSFEM